ncbi:MAG: alpha/beta hydrolase [Bacilli bacterium]|nr:alpha/beta hydrolase [Bacilli bacterium]
MDIKLYYEEKGKGIPLVLLHGNGDDGSYFKHQVDYFSSKYRVITVDTRGHGKSPRGTAPFTMDQFVEDLKDLLDDLKIKKMILLGFSDGANIAIKFALKYSDMIDVLILNGADLTTKGVKKSVQIPIEIGYRIAKLSSKKSEEAKLKAEMLGLMVNEPNIDYRDLSSIKVPTLVIVGTKDMIKEKHSRLIADSLPNSEFKIIEGPHHIANKNPEEFNNEVEKYLDKNIKK